jgi:hypothetical protein
MEVSIKKKYRTPSGSRTRHFLGRNINLKNQVTNSSDGQRGYGGKGGSTPILCPGELQAALATNNRCTVIALTPVSRAIARMLRPRSFMA